MLPYRTLSESQQAMDVVKKIPPSLQHPAAKTVSVKSRDLGSEEVWLQLKWVRLRYNGVTVHLQLL